MPLTNIQKSELLKMREAGATLQAIGDHFGCSKTTVSAAIRRFSLPLHPDPRKPIDEALFREMWMAGAGTTAIGRAIDRSPNSIHDLAATRGLPARVKYLRGVVQVLQPKPAPKAKPDPFPGVTGLDRELLLAGRNESKRAEIAMRHGLTMTQARIKWFRLDAQHGGRQ